MLLGWWPILVLVYVLWQSSFGQTRSNPWRHRSFEESGRKSELKGGSTFWIPTRVRHQRGSRRIWNRWCSYFQTLLWLGHGCYFWTWIDHHKREGEQRLKLGNLVAYIKNHTPPSSPLSTQRVPEYSRHRSFKTNHCWDVSRHKWHWFHLTFKIIRLPSDLCRSSFLVRISFHSCFRLWLWDSFVKEGHERGI